MADLTIKISGSKSTAVEVLNQEGKRIPGNNPPETFPAHNVDIKYVYWCFASTVFAVYNQTIWVGTNVDYDPGSRSLKNGTSVEIKIPAHGSITVTQSGQRLRPYLGNFTPSELVHYSENSLIINYNPQCCLIGGVWYCG